MAPSGDWSGRRAEDGRPLHRLREVIDRRQRRAHRRHLQAAATRGKLFDINMLVITGGQERTNAEYGRLLEAAGLRFGKIEPVTFPYGVIEGSAA